MYIYLVLIIHTVPILFAEGYGNIIGIDAELVIPNTTLSVFERMQYFHGVERKYELVLEMN
jgi:hypothetical protein